MRCLFSSSRKELSRSDANIAYVLFALSLRRSSNGGSAEVVMMFVDVVGCCVGILLWGIAGCVFSSSFTFPDCTL